MSDVTKLKCWPCCVRAIGWSHDGIIALASDDQVELLFPNIESTDSDRETSQWQHFPLQVPWFTKEELPPKNPAPLGTFSVGEEISASYTISLAWSPPGLAKHRRCALAILTSNLVLSIWASEGKAQDVGSWDRRQIVNDALQDYFSGPGAAEEGDRIVSRDREKSQLRRRVRAFAWAPAIESEKPMGVVGTKPSWGRHLIAVSNDDNQVVLLAVNSPTSTLGVDDSWSSDVLGHFSLNLVPENIVGGPKTFDELMDQQRHVPHLAWSPWTTKGDGFQSVLAYATRQDVRARVISYSRDTIIFGPELTYPNIELRFAGPMNWSPRVQENGALTLAIFTTKEVICLSISSRDGSIVCRASHHLDGRWDAISGIAWDVHSKDISHLHFSSQVMTTRCPTAAIELSSTGLTNMSTPDWPYWREQIKGSQGHFSAHHDLKGHANAKVWGLAVSPLGDFVAACHTVHPTDMIEYGTPNDRCATITVSNLWGRGRDLIFPAQAVSSEGILSTVRKWVDNNAETAEDLATAKTEIYKKLVEVYMSVEDSSTTNGTASISYDSPDLRTLIKAFKHKAFLDQNTLKDRYEILASFICTPTGIMELQRILIAFRLAKHIQNLPSTLSSTHELSQKIQKITRQLIRLVQDVISNPYPSASEGAALPPFSNSAYIGSEACTFCDAQIPFSDPSSAVCTNGHEFVRCGLSFLAIQAPNCSKYCGICNTPFLSDEYVMGECVSIPARMGESPEMENEVEKVDEDQIMGEADHVAQAGCEKESTPVPEDQPNERIREIANAPTATNDIPQDGQPRKVDDVDVAAPTIVVDENAQHDDNSSAQSSSQPTNQATRKAQQKEIPITLARVLFLACDACIYCGGKFTG